VTAGRAPRLTALLLAGLVLLLTGVVAAQAFTGHTGSHRTVGEGTALVLALWAIGAVGLVVAWHQPANPIGWLLLAMPVSLLLTFAGDSYDQAYRPGQHALPVLGPAALIMAQLFFFPFIALPLIIWLFPDGRPPPGRWRWVFWACPVLLAPALVAVLVLTAAALATGGPHLHVLADGELPQVENPPPVAVVLSLIFFASLLVSWLCALAYQIASWRRSTGEHRQQLKWLMSGAAICGLSAAASFAGSAALWEVLLLGIVALPVSIGIGILKYRLYDIDRIISRTLAYALLTGLLVGVYAGLVLLATEVLRLTSSVAVAAATLAAAALFNPLRRRLQHLVDRRFNRARYDADAAVAAFAAQTSGAVELDELRADLLGVIGRALEPAHQALRLTGDER
jgi:MFS family permease